jgi:hypothetical protein
MKHNDDHLAKYRTRRLVGAGIGLLLLIFGIVRISNGMQTRWEGKAANAWPTTVGYVTDAWISERSVTTGRTSRPDYSPRLRYEYVVNGRRYEGDRIRAGQEGFSARWRATAILTRYQIGTEVTVYYDPDDPGRAVLEPGWNWMDSYGRLLIGTCFSAIGLLALGVAYPVMRAEFRKFIGALP